MQNLSPYEIEALSKAIGHAFPERSQEQNPSANTSKSYEGMGESPQNPSVNISYAQFPQLAEEPQKEQNAEARERILEVPVHIEGVLGHTTISFEKLMKLTVGSALPLDKMAGEPIDITANGKIIAKGMIVVIEDRFGVKITQILSD